MALGIGWVGNDVLSGTGNDDLIFGLSGNDTLTGGGGNDLIEGGFGFDVAVYAGSVLDFSIQKGAWWCLPYVTVTDLNRADGDLGTDTLFGIEALKFNDVTLRIDGANNAVYTVADAAETGVNTSLTLAAASLLANDRDFDGDPLSLLTVKNAAHGSVSLATDGSILFTPEAGFLGVASFQYVAGDGRGGNSTGTVSVTVSDDEAPVIAAGQSFSSAENRAAGYVIGTVSASDNAAVTGFAITAGNDDGYFAITAAGVFTLTAAGAAAAANDYESPPNAFTLVVEARDAAGNTGTGSIALGVTDVNEGGGGGGSHRVLKLVGENAGDQAGYSVSAAGDVNGDGIDDFVIGAYGSDAGGEDSGAAYVIYGKAGTSQGTLRLDAIADDTETSDGFKIIGGMAHDNAGFSVSSAGDVNGDGIDDILIGAYGDDAGGDASGAAYVIYGKTGSDRGTIDLYAIASSPADGFKIVGEAASDYAGFSVSAAGT